MDIDGCFGWLNSLYAFMGRLSRNDNVAWFIDGQRVSLNARTALSSESKGKSSGKRKILSCYPCFRPD
jgi:hypothetical protein